MAAKGVLRSIDGNCLGFWCPGCEEMHVVNSGWTFDGNYEKPTFSPSILVTVGHYTPSHRGDCWCTWNERHPNDSTRFKCSRCHSFVRNGRIEFLSDCSHALAGQTVELLPPPAHEETP